MKILIADDDEKSLYFLRFMLEKQGYEVTPVKNGVEALAELAKGEYDIIISDILMPKMDGFQFCRKCKNNVNLKNIPFIFYTAAYTDKEDEIFALSLGADKGIVKPQTPEKFLEILKGVIEEYEKRKPGLSSISTKDEVGYLKDYTQRLINMLEKKVLDLENGIAVREQAEEKLRESERKYRTIVNNINDALLIYNFKGEILEVNENTCNFLGHRKDELIGKHLTEIESENAVGLMKEIMKKIIREGHLIFDSESAKKNGECVPVTISARVVSREGGGVIQSFVRDITERKQLDKLKDDFISMVSHELRTPLSTMKEFASIILDEIPGKLTNSQREYMDIIKGNINRLTRLINSLLDISKIEADKTELKEEFIDIVGLVKGVIEVLMPSVDKKHIKVKAVFYPDSLNVLVDSDKIVQVFTNLIENAIKFTQEFGQIKVKIIDKKKEIECSVADTGTGIAPENFDKLFGKFQQFDRVSGSGAKGTGLGLAISKGLVEMHNGRIWAESKYGRGSKFVFTLPKKNELDYLKDVFEKRIKQVSLSGESLAILFIEIVNPKELNEKLDKDNYGKLFATIRDRLSAVLRAKDDEIIVVGEDKIAVVFVRKKVKDITVVTDRLKLALRIKLFLGKGLSAEVKLCFSLEIHNKKPGKVEGLVLKVQKMDSESIVLVIGKREIVFVDDEEDFLELVKSNLEAGGEYHVHTYSKAGEAVEGIILIRPEVVITDVMMPEMNGYEFVGRLSEYEGFEQIPIIFVTGYDIDEKKLRAVRSKRLIKLGKPFEMEELIEKINYLKNRR